jgi:hypothetical protein
MVVSVRGRENVTSPGCAVVNAKDNTYRDPSIEYLLSAVEMMWMHAAEFSCWISLDTRYRLYMIRRV